MSDHRDAESRHDSAEEHGDSPEVVDEDHDVTNPSNEPAEAQVDDLFGGQAPLR